MKLIIAGSRDLPLPYIAIDRALVAYNIPREIISEVVSGVARGADQSGEEWAKIYGIPIQQFHADWIRYGKAAGPIRNKVMGQYADAALIFMNDASTGSMNMAKVMSAMKKPAWLVVVKNRTIITKYMHNDQAFSFTKRLHSDNGNS